MSRPLWDCGICGDGPCRRTEGCPRLPAAAAFGLSDLHRTEALEPGDPCEWRYPARSEWNLGRVVRNGGSGYWRITDDESGDEVQGLYIEWVRAVGTDPWGWVESR
jgi:hypothetical protein